MGQWRMKLLEKFLDKSFWGMGIPEGTLENPGWNYPGGIPEVTFEAAFGDHSLKKFLWKFFGRNPRKNLRRTSRRSLGRHFWKSPVMSFWKNLGRNSWRNARSGKKRLDEVYKAISGCSPALNTELLQKKNPLESIQERSGFLNDLRDESLLLLTYFCFGGPFLRAHNS